MDLKNDLIKMMNNYRKDLLSDTKVKNSEKSADNKSELLFGNKQIDNKSNIDDIYNGMVSINSSEQKSDNLTNMLNRMSTVKIVKNNIEKISEDINKEVKNDSVKNNEPSSNTTAKNNKGAEKSKNQSS